MTDKRQNRRRNKGGRKQVVSQQKTQETTEAKNEEQKVVETTEVETVTVDNVEATETASEDQGSQSSDEEDSSAEQFEKNPDADEVVPARGETAFVVQLDELPYVDTHADMPDYLAGEVVMHEGATLHCLNDVTDASEEQVPEGLKTDLETEVVLSTDAADEEYPADASTKVMSVESMLPDVRIEAPLELMTEQLEEPEAEEKPKNLVVEMFEVYHEKMGRHYAPKFDEIDTAQYSLESALVSTLLVEPTEQSVQTLREVIAYTRTESKFTFSEARMSRRISFLHAKSPAKRRRMSALMHILARLSTDGREFKVSFANLVMMLGNEREAQNLRINCNRAFSMQIA